MKVILFSLLMIPLLSVTAQKVPTDTLYLCKHKAILLHQGPEKQLSRSYYPPFGFTYGCRSGISMLNRIYRYQIPQYLPLHTQSLLPGKAADLEYKSSEDKYIAGIYAQAFYVLPQHAILSNMQYIQL